MGHFASPVIDSFITNILPVLIQLFGELSQTVNTVMQEVQKIFDAVWKGTVIPVLDLATEVITGFFSSIKQFWDKWGKPIFDALRVAITNVGDTVLNIYNATGVAWYFVLDYQKSLYTIHFDISHIYRSHIFHVHMILQQQY